MRSKDIGTVAESQTVRYLAANGFPQAERRALRGGKDCGDVTGLGPVVIEVKAGAAAKTASDGQIGKWLEETATETANAGADIGILVVVRAQKNVRDWWACMTMATYQELLTGLDIPEPLASLQCRTTLASATIMLRSSSYGDAL